MEIRDLIAIAWRRKWTIAAVVLVALVASAGFALTRQKEYQSTVTLAMTPNVAKGQGFVASDELATLLSTYSAIAQSSKIENVAAGLLGHPLNASVAASSTAGTGILQISATSTSPTDAQSDARALGQAFQTSISNNGLLIVQTVDQPALPTAPQQPRPPLIIATGLLLGIALAVALAVILERLFDRIDNADDVTEAVHLATLGLIPRCRALRPRNANPVVWGRADLATAQEAFRSLRTNVHLQMKADERVLLVTSAHPGEGKSTVAANIAVALASVGQSTVLVDSDFRAPRQHEIFDVPNDLGLSAVMRGPRIDLADLLQPTRFENLQVLPAGPMPTNPTETIAAQIGVALDRLRGLEALIVIDAAPVLAVSDPRLIAQDADAVLVVVACGRSKAGALRHTLEQLRQTHARIAGVVLNRVKDTGSLYGAYASAYRQQPQEIETPEPTSVRRRPYLAAGREAGGGLDLDDE